MILHCIRHGVTVGNLAGRFNGVDDDPLDASAVAALGATVFRSEAYDLIYVSPLPRCIQTAERLGLRDWLVDPRIAERHLGVFQGLTAAECRRSYASDFEAFSRFEAEPAIPEGESRAQHLERVLDWLEEVARRFPSRVLAVTHGGVIDFLFRMGSGRPLHGGDQIFGGDNLALSSFEVTWPAVRLLGYSQPL